MISPQEEFKDFVHGTIKRGGRSTSIGNPEEYLYTRLNDHTAIALDRPNCQMWYVHITMNGDVIMNLERTFEKDN